MPVTKQHVVVLKVAAAPSSGLRLHCGRLHHRQLITARLCRRPAAEKSLKAVAESVREDRVQDGIDAAAHGRHAGDDRVPECDALVSVATLRNQKQHLPAQCTKTAQLVMSLMHLLRRCA